MIEELRVRHLGVVDDVGLVLHPGMTVITGETGAGKTLLTEAIRLLTGGKAEPHMVRLGTTEASVEGRFVSGAKGEEVEQVLSRVVPANGRSRSYVDGKMIPTSALGELGERYVDLHGQNAHQRLLSSAAQRDGLDAFGSVDISPLRNARRRRTDIENQLASLGGDAQTRAREIDLLQFQLEELDAAQLTDENEDDALLAEERSLADAGEHRDAAAALYEALAGDGGANETLAVALKATAQREPLADLNSRLVAVVNELEDLGAEASSTMERLVDDPQRLAEVQDRRAALKTLQRKYGPALADVIAYREGTRIRLAELMSHDETVAKLEAEYEEAARGLQAAEKVVRAARVAAAPLLARSVEAQLRQLALPNARFEVTVGENGAGDEVAFLLGPNPGMPLLPIAKAASGGELARVMLALRLALLGSEEAMSALSDTEAAEPAALPDTLIFDEVDAGIGGEAALAVGRALGSLARGSGPSRQVFVVTHLAQVAAFADHHVMVEKQQGKDTTESLVHVLGAEDREVELARMLSGQPDSETGRLHARELLVQAKTTSEVDLRDIAASNGAKPKKRAAAKRPVKT